MSRKKINTPDILTPKFTYHDVRYAVDEQTFARAEGMIRQNKVTNVQSDSRGWRALVSGTKQYRVGVSARHADVGYCACPMGERDYLCKHMIALALTVLEQSGAGASPLTDMATAKKQITAGMRKFTPYGGSSATWFSYTGKLAVGAGMVQDALPVIEPSEQSVQYLWGVVRKICDKLATTGIDDSDGAVGGCVTDIVLTLGGWAKTNPELLPLLQKCCNDDTHFGFEDELRAQIKVHVT